MCKTSQAPSSLAAAPSESTEPADTDTSLCSSGLLDGSIAPTEPLPTVAIADAPDTKRSKLDLA
jgi:hypothetical protein